MGLLFLLLVTAEQQLPQLGICTYVRSCLLARRLNHSMPGICRRESPNTLRLLSLVLQDSSFLSLGFLCGGVGTTTWILV